MGIHLELKYPMARELDLHSFSNLADRNTFVDAVLQCVYDHVRTLPAAASSRSIFFSSFNPSICTVVNWKQPNCKMDAFFHDSRYSSWSTDAVFFSTYCGLNKDGTRGVKRRLDQDEAKDSSQDDVRCRSLKEAVKFAKRNNLLGIICEATPLVSTKKRERRA